LHSIVCRSFGSIQQKTARFLGSGSFLAGNLPDKKVKVQLILFEPRFLFFARRFVSSVQIHSRRLRTLCPFSLTNFPLDYECGYHAIF
jgi:hypothetical protein